MDKHFYEEKIGRLVKHGKDTNGVCYEVRLNNKNSYNLYFNDVLVLKKKAKKTIINYLYNNYKLKVFKEV